MTNKDEIPTIIIVSFELPFTVRWCESISKDKRPDGYEDLLINMGEYPVMLRFEHRILEGFGGVSVALEDFVGANARTIVQVWFDHQFTSATGISSFRQNVRTVQDAAIKAVNRFLEFYREERDAPWIRPLNRAAIPAFIHQDVKEGQVLDQFTRGGYTHSPAGLGMQLPSEAEARLRHRLASRGHPNLLHQIALDIVDESRHGRYMSAILQLGVLYETWSYRALTALLQAKGLSEKDIEKEIGRNDHIVEVMKRVCREAGVDLSGGDGQSRWNAWRSLAKEVRDDIAHGRDPVLSFEDVRAAMRSTSGLMELASQQSTILADVWHPTWHIMSE